MLAQAVGYAAAALGHIALAAGKPLLVKDIADACGIPPAYLAKIVNQLARRGILSTQRGIGGGVTLARSPHDISLFELCESLGDPIVQCRCLLSAAPCSDDRACPAHAFWKVHRASLVEFLQRMSVAQMAEFEFRRGSSGPPPHLRHDDAPLRGPQRAGGAP